MGFDEQFKQALADIRKVAGKKVKYQRGNDFVWLCAARGNHQSLYDADQSAHVDYEEKEWLIGVDDLKIAGEYVKPQRGDLIIEEIGTKRFTYETLKSDAADDYWTYSEAGKSTIRVFTKLKTEADI